ncbi:MAG: hypothetical protein IKR76_06970 [Ruminococcus sp.]|nr:hypothetical protein [Ruminococcus sp.]
MRKRIITLLLAGMMLILLAPAVMAEASADIALSKQHTFLGDEVTATVTFKSDKNDIADIQGSISYNDKVLEYVSCDDVSFAGRGTLGVRAFTDSGAEGKYSMTITFKTIGEGDGFIRLVNCRMTDSTQSGVQSPSAEASIEVQGSAETTEKPKETTAQTEKPDDSTTTTTAPEESSSPDDTQTEQTTTTAPAQTNKPADGEIPEGKLAELKISTGYISPAFSYDVLEYDIKVPHDCTWLDLEGVPSLEGGYIWYTGDENVYDGVITRTIAVRDSLGNETVYTFHISRMTAEEEESFVTSTVTSAPESTKEVTTTTRKLSLDKKSTSFKKLIAGAGIVVVVILVVIVSLVSSKSSSKKRKRIKQSKRKK